MNTLGNYSECISFSVSSMMAKSWRSSRSYSALTAGFFSIRATTCSWDRLGGWRLLSKSQLLHSFGSFAFLFPRHISRFLHHNVQNNNLPVYLCHKNDSVPVFRLIKTQLKHIFVVMPRDGINHLNTVALHAFSQTNKIGLQTDGLGKKLGDNVIIVIFNGVVHRLKNNSNVIFLRLRIYRKERPDKPECHRGVYPPRSKGGVVDVASLLIFPPGSTTEQQNQIICISLIYNLYIYLLLY